jgi:hypothetical protein
MDDRKPSLPPRPRSLPPRPSPSAKPPQVQASVPPPSSGITSSLDEPFLDSTSLEGTPIDGAPTVNDARALGALFFSQLESESRTLTDTAQMTGPASPRDVRKDPPASAQSPSGSLPPEGYSAELFQGTRRTPPPAKPRASQVPFRPRVETADSFNPPADRFVPNEDLLWRPGGDSSLRIPINHVPSLRPKAASFEDAAFTAPAQDANSMHRPPAVSLTSGEYSNPFARTSAQKKLTLRLLVVLALTLVVIFVSFVFLKR